jgi:hypothetical protein
VKSSKKEESEKSHFVGGISINVPSLKALGSALTNKLSGGAG